MDTTDAQLCEKVLGWQLHKDGETWLTPGGCTHVVPDFARDIEWAMKLARAACDKWGMCYWVGRVRTSRVGRVVRASLYSEAGTWVADAEIDEEAAAIRAAVAKVYEAHDPKSPP